MRYLPVSAVMLSLCVACGDDGGGGESSGTDDGTGGTEGTGDGTTGDPTGTGGPGTSAGTGGGTGGGTGDGTGGGSEGTGAGTSDGTGGSTDGGSTGGGSTDGGSTGGGSTDGGSTGGGSTDGGTTGGVQGAVLTVNVTGDGFGSITVDGMECGTADGTCMFNLDPGVDLDVSATARDVFSELTGWSGECTGQDPTCRINLSGDATLGVRFDLAGNVAFVSSQAYGALDIGALPGTGIAAKVDAECTRLAAAADLHGSTWIGWMAGDGAGEGIADRLGSARGFIRRDGRPVADTFADLTDFLINPILFDETGARADVLAWTGVDGDEQPSDDCQGWTTDSGLESAAAGYSGAVFAWVNGLGPTCDASARIYCLGVDSTDALPTELPRAARVAFVSTPGFALDSGRDAADALCQAEATAATLSGTFKAALSTSAEAFHERFNLTGETWVRVDGQPVFESAADLANATATSLTSIHQRADGSQMPTLDNVVFGRNCFGGGESCCLDWTDDDWTPDPEFTSAHSVNTRAFTDFATSVSCGATVPVFCLQE